ncbi:hypothetical protein [Sodaliphilus pleomorphus]|jgi:hypothetical protein|nr:hypothetical protein [Sodaliphilus pleomorphus]
MGVLKMKPHRLAYWLMTDGYVDENGDPHEGERTLVDYCECDLKPAGSANVIQFEDGVAESYSYTIYLPANSRKFKRGDKIVVTYFDLQTEFIVKGFQRYQLQCKIWV